MASSTATTPVLPPQTTPFVPSVPCSLSVYCRYMSDSVYSSKAALSAHPLSGQACQAFYTTSQGSSIQPVEACLPPRYVQLFGDNALNLDSPPAADVLDAMATAAYPGTACIQGWTSACSAVGQIWCCPGDRWTCQTAGPDRLCTSIMTEATDIWMSFDPPKSVASLDSPVYTWHRQVSAEPQPQYAATVFHYAFPLQAASINTASSSWPGTSTSTLQSTSNITSSLSTLSINTLSSQPSGGQLTGGEIAGIAIGAAALFFLLLVVAILVVLSRRPQQKRNDDRDNALNVSVPLNVQEADVKGDLSTGSTFSAFPKAELDAMSPATSPTHRVNSQNAGVSPLTNMFNAEDRTPRQQGQQSPATNRQVYELQG